MDTSLRPVDHSLRAVLSAIFANAIVTMAKLFGWLASQSPSMLAETIHSAIDTFNQLLLLIGIRHGAGKPSRRYPFGMGQARYVWNLVSAIGIFFVGFGFTTSHGVMELLTPTELDTSDLLIPLIILAVSLLAEGYSWTVALKAVNHARGERGLWDYIKKGDDPTAVAVLLEDSVAVLGVCVAFISIWFAKSTGSHIPDAIGSIVIGGLLGLMAIVLGIANGRILMGIAADPDIEADIREFLERYPSVERVALLRTAVLSPSALRLAVEIEFHGGILINRQQIERDAERVRDGEDPAQVLFETAERTVRLVGREINKLESALFAEFPEIKMIDLEVN
jgi:zinc transporter 9